MAIFGSFQNALIFRILEVFWSCFLHRTTAMCCRNVFSMFLCIFNFYPKIKFFAKSIAFAWWPFLAIFKMLSFFEYKLFFEAVFCMEQLQCVVETFLACFYAFFKFLTQIDDF